MHADFNRILSFLCVCEHGTITKAAEQLFITPQALNKQIRVLEEELGEKLFLHTTRRLELTDFGVFFRNQMQPVCQLYQSAQQQVDTYLNRAKRALRVGFFQGVPKRRVIQPVLTELMVGLPDVQIELGSAEMDELYTSLRSHKIDLAIANVRPGEPLDDLVQIPLMPLPCSVVVSYLHPWMAKEQVTREDLSSSPVLFLSRTAGPDQDGFYGQLQASSYQFAPTYNAMLAQLGVGKHYAVFPTLFENLSEIGLKTFPLPEAFDFNFSLSLVYHPDNRFADFFATLTCLQPQFGAMLIDT